ncbi:MAG: hypothetical protein LBP28_08380, partial [Coriobacteriales bacterium]|nr:hypothetical protein [Coriobacteriales bacterium]
LLLNAALPAIIVCGVVMLGGVLVTLYGRARLARDRDLSNTAITLVVMLLALAAQFGLTYLFTTAGVIGV